MTRETFCRLATTSRSVSTVVSISLRATAAKPAVAVTGDSGAIWSSDAAKAGVVAASASAAHTAAGIDVRNEAGSRDERMDGVAKTTQDAGRSAKGAARKRPEGLQRSCGTGAKRVNA